MPLFLLLIPFPPSLEVPLPSSEVATILNMIQSDSSVVTINPVLSGSSTKTYPCRDEIAKLLFHQKLLKSFAPKVSLLNSTLVVSTGALAITHVAPTSTEAPLSPTNIINPDSLIHDVDATYFDST